MLIEFWVVHVLRMSLCLVLSLPLIADSPVFLSRFSKSMLMLVVRYGLVVLGVTFRMKTAKFWLVLQSVLWVLGIAFGKFLTFE